MKLDSLPQGVRIAVEAAQNKKAAGITVLDLSGVGAFTDYFVICTGFSTPQVQAICGEVEEQLEKQLHRSPKLVLPDEPGVAARNHSFDSFDDSHAAGEAYSK